MSPNRDLGSDFRLDYAVCIHAHDDSWTAPLWVVVGCGTETQDQYARRLWKAAARYRGDRAVSAEPLGVWMPPPSGAAR